MTAGKYFYLFLLGIAMGVIGARIGCGLVPTMVICAVVGGYIAYRAEKHKQLRLTNGV